MQGDITFYVLAGIAIFSAAMAVTRRKVFYGCVYFGLSSLANSGIFLQLHAPSLFIAELVAMACAMVGIILFAVEVSTLNVALAGEDRWRSRATALGATLVLILLTALAALQSRLLQPGENLIVLLPRGPVGPPPQAAELIKFFGSNESLPLTLILFILLIGAVGFAATFQKRART